MIPLEVVLLIDAHGINPEPKSIHLFPSPYGVQELPQILPYMIWLSVNFD
jgi:hypothetical protein